MAYTNPGVGDFKNFFVRDFPYGTDPATSIIDQDIENAFLEADLNVNTAFFETQAAYNLGYLLMSAHFLVISIRASSQGISGQYSWLQTNKSVGSVSEGMQIPPSILNNPALAMLSKTNYGARYLMIILPKMVGQIFTVCGKTTA